VLNTEVERVFLLGKIKTENYLYYIVFKVFSIDVEGAMSEKERIRD
jgi:hypothetical protein